MFGSDILEVAIGMVFLYLFMSMIASALREAFEAFLQQRAVFLERGLEEMLRGLGPDGVQKFYDHPMISSLYRGDYENRSQPIFDISGLSKALDFVFGYPRLPELLPKRSLLPAYIPSANFSLALLDLVAAASAAGEALSVRSLRQALMHAKPPNAVQRVVLMALSTADDDLAAVQKYIENWYDATMQRVTGWYARRSAVFLFVFGLSAAVVLNVDSITIAKSLIVDRPLRQAIVSQAETYARNPPKQANVSGDDRAAVAPPLAAASPAVPVGQAPADAQTGDRGKHAAPAAGVDAIPKPVSVTQNNFEDLRTEFAEVGYPIGWATGEDGWWYPAPQGCRRVPDDRGKGEAETRNACGRSGSYVGLWLLAIMGWLITAIAIMLGAPFWFDLLNKLVSLRSALKPPEAKPSPKQAKAAAAPPAV